MDLINFLRDKMIWLNNPCQDSSELFQMVAEQAMQIGLVTDTFLSKLNEREKSFPTGIQLSGYGVAIPHTDPECIKQQFVGIVIPNKQILFKSMENENNTVGANVIFVLGLNEPHSQLTTLQQIMRIIQNKNYINQMVEAKDTKEIIQIVRQSHL